MKFTPQFWAEYLPLLAVSIKVAEQSPEAHLNPKFFVAHRTWGSKNWTARAERWAQTKGVVWYHTKFNDILESNFPVNYHICIPLFPSLLRRCPSYENVVNCCATNSTTQSNPEQENTTMKNTINKLVDKNKDAVAIAAKLTTGKTANSFFLNKLVGKFPWYAKVFSKKNDLATNPVAKMVAAQTAMTLVTHFAADNKKLNYVAEGMVQEALCDITVNSSALESIIKELENLVTLPDFGKDA